jgi:hypothetical protein
MSYRTLYVCPIAFFVLRFEEFYRLRIVIATIFVKVCILILSIFFLRGNFELIRGCILIFLTLSADLSIFIFMFIFEAFRFFIG